MKKLRSKLIIDIETNVEDSESTEATLRYMVEDDLSEIYTVHSCELEDNSKNNK